MFPFWVGFGSEIGQDTPMGLTLGGNSDLSYRLEGLLSFSVVTTGFVNKSTRRLGRMFLIKSLKVTFNELYSTLRYSKY